MHRFEKYAPRRAGTKANLIALMIAIPAGFFLVGAIAQTAAPEALAQAADRDKPPEKARPPHGSNTLGLLTDDQNETDRVAAIEIAALIGAGQETGPHNEQALRIAPVPSRGGFENIRALLTLAEADLSIVPVPLLERAPAAPGLGNLRKKIAYVAPLFKEEFRLLASSPVENIYDLAGKTVNLGAKDSASDILGRDLFETLGVDIKPVNLDSGPVDAVANGEIVADLLIGGGPQGLLAQHRPGHALRLITIPRLHALGKDFLSATLTHASEPDLIPPGARVETVAVRSVLIAYNWPKGSHRYELMAYFVRTLFSRFLELKTGADDSKWLEADLDTDVPGWPRFPPARRWLDQKGVESNLSR